MPSLAVLLTFTGACVLLALTPGPNMSLIIANTLSGGFRAGLVTLFGAAIGLATLVTIAALGMTSVMVFMADWFEVIRWLGAIYLVVLGAMQLRAFWRRRAGSLPPPPGKAGGAYFAHGLAVALSNPKVLLFLGAFLPQFVDPTLPAGRQLAVLAVLFTLTLFLVDLGYTIAVARARQVIDAGRLNLLDGFAGGLLVVGGVLLATARRP